MVVVSPGVAPWSDVVLGLSVWGQSSESAVRLPVPARVPVGLVRVPLPSGRRTGSGSGATQAGSLGGGDVVQITPPLWTPRLWVRNVRFGP
ncbi:hypothetical protein SKAU_G00164180 [Synaphobranchus kaupii]|uniref:Uncharacterized protein n=1 Tax=Synaphobranchus kaupii TaxID=118154 RepID=A0A9Q1FJA2_SYNKA|nr:hypothetical protein SKAU_G00164180 [Synaphobranchus kaupii]